MRQTAETFLKDMSVSTLHRTGNLEDNERVKVSIEEEDKRVSPAQLTSHLSPPIVALALNSELATSLLLFNPVATYIITTQH